MSVHRRVSYRDILAGCLRSRSCWAILVVIAVTLGVLWLALVDIDPTPHVPPNSAVELTTGVGIALTAQVSALVCNFRDERRALLRRIAADPQTRRTTGGLS